MRSSLIYNALHTVQNRYMLCQAAAKATRRFHRPNTRIQDTTNEVLTRIATTSERERVFSIVNNRVAEQQRRAA